MPGDFFEWISILIAIGSGVWVLASKLTTINETLKQNAVDNKLRDKKLADHEKRIDGHDIDIRAILGRLG